MSEIIEAVRPAEFGGKYQHNKWTYHVPMDPIPESSIKETFTSDIIIIGAGASGKAAALTAVQAGAKVIQIDRHTTFRYSGGHVAAIDSRLQKKLGVKVDKEQAILQLMRYMGNFPDQRFIRQWADNSGSVIDWIMDLTEPAGVSTVMYQWPQPPPYDPKTEYYPEFPVCHYHTFPGVATLDHSLSLKQFEKAALDRGLDLRYQIRAMQLVRQPNGRVTGVIAMDKKGKYIQFNAKKALILCTGDYGNNPWMMQKYSPHVADAAIENNIYMTRNEDLRVAPEPLDTGDGFQMAFRIGAVMQASPGAGIVHATSGTAGNAPFLRVNILGRRYENEDVPAPTISNGLMCQPGKTAWQIFDSKWESEIPLMGIGLGKYYPIKDTIRQQVETASLKADTIEELARKMDIPVKTLKATVERYNELTKKGKDLDFAKRPDRMTVIDKPPFYASKAKYEFLCILGGLNSNMRQQALDAQQNPIQGLYLAGNSIGNRFAIDYPTMCPGMTHNMAYLSGRFAGQFAAAEQA